MMKDLAPLFCPPDSVKKVNVRVVVSLDRITKYLTISIIFQVTNKHSFFYEWISQGNRCPPFSVDTYA